MQRLFLVILFCFVAPVTLASGPKLTISQPPLPWKQRQEVAMREATFQYLIRNNARNWKGVRQVLMATGAPPAVFRRLISDGFAVVDKESEDKTQVFYVTEAPVWVDKTHARILVRIDFLNIAISTPTFLHGTFEKFRLRLRRHGEHWRVRSIINDKWPVMVA